MSTGKIKKMKAGIIVLFCLFICISSVFSQSDWQLAKEKNGIKVFTLTEGASKYKSIKVEANFAGTLQKLVKILRNVGNNKDWVYATKQSYVIKQISSNEVLYYSETALPWPVSNRDIPVRMRMNVNAANNVLVVTAAGEPDAMPVQKGIVRVQSFNSSWNVKYDGKNSLKITYYLKMDPSGNVPTQVTNMFITKGPFDTFENLAKLLK